MSVVLLVDGNPLLWRAAYAGYGNRENSSLAKGVLGYFYDVIYKFRPQELVVCWDKGMSWWRSQLYPDYKAHRLEKKRESDIDLEMVEEQAGYVRRYLEALGVRQVIIPGVEADDGLGWLSEHYLGRIEHLPDWKVVISTGDHDLWQLVRADGRILVWDQQKEIMVDHARVVEALGVPPERVPDLKALMGDASDNLPGIKGIGQKIGAKLLGEYETLGALMGLEEDLLKELAKRKTTAKILALVAPC